MGSHEFVLIVEIRECLAGLIGLVWGSSGFGGDGRMRGCWLWFSRVHGNRLARVQEVSSSGSFVITADTTVERFCKDSGLHYTPRMKDLHLCI